MPKITVALPNYNGEKYLEEAIQSVLDQTFQDFELLIADDASNDSSLQIIEKYKELDSRIRVMHNDQNRHIPYTGTLLLEAAAGEYIARIDSDDIWCRDRLEKQLEYMESHPDVGACFSKIILIDGGSEEAGERFPGIQSLFNNVKNRTQEEWIRFFFYHGNCLCNSSSLIRTETLRAAGAFYRLAFMPGEDYELWSRIVLHSQIYVFDEPLVCYRWTEEEGKVSHVVDDGLNPIKNMEMLLRDIYLDEMDEDMFIRTFGEDFRNKKSNTQLELEIEKAFLLLDCAGKATGNINFLGIRRFLDLLDRPGVLDVLEKHYDFDLKVFYKRYYVRNFYDYQAEIDAGKYTELIVQVQHTEQECNRYKALVQKYEEEIESRTNELQCVQEIVGRQEHELQSAKAVIGRQERELQGAREVIERQGDELQALKKKEEELSAIKNSIIWKTSMPVRIIADKVREIKKNDQRKSS